MTMTSLYDETHYPNAVLYETLVFVYRRESEV